jgi:hypothetical protein
VLQNTLHTSEGGDNVDSLRKSASLALLEAMKTDIGIELPEFTVVSRFIS